MDNSKTEQDVPRKPIIKGMNYHVSDQSLRNLKTEAADLSAVQSLSPSLDNARLQQLQSSSISSASSKSTSIKTSKTVATASMSMEGMKKVSVRSASASSTKSRFTGGTASSCNKIIEESSKLVENITEMQNLFQQSNVSESLLEQIESHCQSLETFLPPSSRQTDQFFKSMNSPLIRSTSSEIGFRFKQARKRTNLAYIRLLRQLVNEVGLDAALNGSVGAPILEAFCASPNPKAKSADTAKQFKGLVSNTDLSDSMGASRLNNSKLSTGGNLSHAVRLLMAKGRDVAVDGDLNNEFVALIEKMTTYNENTCQDVIEEGGLEYVFRACRSEDTETVRHAVLSMVNLLHRVGKDHQYEMARRNTFAWLFLLAMHQNEEIQYYAFLIVTILSNNRELDSVLDRSQLISLMVTFVKRHDVREFARRNFTDQTPIFADEWLVSILPALVSETHSEIQAFAAFHFAIAAELRANFLQQMPLASKARVESALVRVSGMQRDPAWKLAALSLDTIGSKVPKALSLQVFNWPVDDVLCWLNREGFEGVADKVKSLKIDGDILLGLTEQELKEGLGMTNCIDRRRFLRQLGHLKSIAIYSQIDPTGIADFLTEATEDNTDSLATNADTLSGGSSRQSLTAAFATASSSAATICSIVPTARLTQYTYNLISHGVTRSRLPELKEEDLEKTCHISDAIHRRYILSAVHKITNGGRAKKEALENRIDFFISYRRSNGTHLASLVKTLLQLRRFRVFLDIERLKGGRFDYKLMDSIKRSDNFILVLTEGALDRCSTDGSIDWVRREINCALENNCHIIPLSDRFDWGNTDTLPEDIRAITKFNSVQWTPEFEEGCIDRIIEFMRQNAQTDEVTPTSP